MRTISRRFFLAAMPVTLAGCAGGLSTTRIPVVGVQAAPQGAGFDPSFLDMYGPIDTEPFPVPEVDLTGINPIYLRRIVSYSGPQQPGTVVIDPNNRFLFLVQERGQAIRYGVGVGREGFGWAGTATIKRKSEWPDWYPPKEMIARQPEIKRVVEDLPGGLGMPGGPDNPLGARAHYLYQGAKDTLYRIHGTIEPHTIGTRVSSGCIRMINQDVIDLYGRVPIGTTVVVLGPHGGGVGDEDLYEG
jgi:lipoprotein-anchoring transpeptidase ErfK/SrfK